MAGGWRARRHALGLAGRQGRLLAEVGLSGLAQSLPLLTNLLVTPYLIHVLGLDGFGVWSLFQVFLGTLTILDGGVGASLARFYAVHAARDDRAGTARLLAGSLLVFLAIGVIVGAAAFMLAPFAGARLHAPPLLQAQTTQALHWLGPLVVLALVSNSAVSLLQAHRRFLALANTTLASSVAYGVGVVLFARTKDSMLTLIAITAARYAVIIVGGIGVGAKHLALERPMLPEKALRREFNRYARRMQASAMTSFLNGEADAVIIGALLPVRDVGIYAAGYQVAIGLRSLPLYAFPPILTRMASVYAHQGLRGTVRLFDEMQARWLPIVLGYGAVAACAAGFGVQVWLGRSYALSGVVAAVLISGYSVHVAITGLRTCFVRSIGEPGLETRYSVFSTITNVAMTLPFALLFGVVGVVSATAVALTLGSLYFARLCRRRAGLQERMPTPRWFGVIVLGVLVTMVGELLVVHTHWHGTLALALVGIPALLGLCGLASHAVSQSRPAAAGPVLPKLSPGAK